MLTLGWRPFLVSAALLILGFADVHSQEPYFFKRINGSPGQFDYHSSGGILLKDGSVLYPFSSSSFSQYWGLNVVKIDEGAVQELSIVQFEDSLLSFGVFDAFFLDSIGDYVLCGVLSYSDQQRSMVIKLDTSNGDTNFFSIPLDSFQSGFNDGLLLNDGSYLFVGFSEEYDEGGDFLLVNMSSNGEVVWKKELGTEYRDLARSIDQAPNGDLYVLGHSEGYGSQIGVKSDLLLIKTDKFGNELWRRSWGRESGECAGETIVLSDGGVLVVGCIADSLEGDPSYSGFVRKFTSSGSISWHVEFPNNESTNFATSMRSIQSVIELESGWIMCVGVSTIWKEDSSSQKQVPGIVVLDAEGNQIMQRTYESLTKGYSDSQFGTIIELPDGGFTVFGTYFVGFGDTGTQDVFIVELDSNACEYPNCQPPLFASQPTRDQTFVLFPNPTHDVLNISDPNRFSKLELIDLMGKRMKFEYLGDGQIDVSELNPGLYTLIGHAIGERFVGRFVKQ